MKNFITMSREQAINYTKQEVKEEYMIISISEPNEEKPIFTMDDKLVDVLYLSFEDISEYKEARKLITNKDGIAILGFINFYENVNNVIIHCTMGVSRSVSIKCALEEIYNKRPIGVFPEKKEIDQNKIYTLDELETELDNIKDDKIKIYNKLCYAKIKECAKNMNMEV